MLRTFVVDTTPPAATASPTGPSFGNIAVLLVILAIAYPIIVGLRRRLSDRRVARWAEEEQRGSATAPNDSDD